MIGFGKTFKRRAHRALRDPVERVGVGVAHLFEVA